MATMKRARLLLAATILSSLVLTGCGKTRVRLEPLPLELTVCADEPAAPALPAQDWAAALETIMLVQGARDQLMLDYALGLRSAWGDCRSKVDGAKAWNARVGQ